MFSSGWAQGRADCHCRRTKVEVLTPIEMDFAIDDIVRLAIDPSNIMIFDSKSEQNILFMK
jgi:hypothetical protein